MKKNKRLLLTTLIALTMTACSSNSGNSKSEELNNLIDSNNRMKIYSETRELTDEGYYLTTSKSGLADQKGSAITDLQYDVTNKLNDYYYVVLDDQTGLINENGEEVLPLESGRKIITSSDNIFYTEDNKTIICDSSLEQIGEFEGAFEYVWDKDNFILNQDGKYGLVDGEGKEKIPFEYEDMMYLSKESGDKYELTYFTAKKNGKWGILDKEGKEVIPFEYDPVYSGMGGIQYIGMADAFIAIKDGNICVFDKQNQVKAELPIAENAPYQSFNEYDDVFYITSPDKSYIFNEDCEVVAELNGLLDYFPYKNGLFEVRNNVELSSDGMGLSYSGETIADKSGKTLFTSGYNGEEISQLELGDEGIVVVKPVKQGDLGGPTKTTVYDHDLNVIKEFDTDNNKNISLAQGYDTSVNYILLHDSQAGEVGSTTVYNMKGEELFTVEGYIESLLDDSHFIVEQANSVWDETKQQSVTYDREGNETENVRGIVDLEGNLVIEAKYKDFYAGFDDGYIVSNTDDHSDIYDKDYKKVISSESGTYLTSL